MMQCKVPFWTTNNFFYIHAYQWNLLLSQLAFLFTPLFWVFRYMFMNDVNIHSTAKMFESASSHISYVKSKVASDQTSFFRAVSENMPQSSSFMHGLYMLLFYDSLTTMMRIWIMLLSYNLRSYRFGHYQVISIITNTIFCLPYYIGVETKASVQCLFWDW